MKRSICFLALWLAVLLALGAWYLLLAPRSSEYSPEENRTLAAFPTLTAESLFSGRFGQEFEQYLLDRFPGRSAVISATNKLQGALSCASHEDYLLIAQGPEDLLDEGSSEEDLDDLLNDLTAPPETTLETLPETTPETTAEATVETTAETTAPIETTEALTLEDFPDKLCVYMDRGKGESAVTSYSKKRVAAVTALLNKFARLLPEDGVLTFTVVPQSTTGNRYVRAAEKRSFYSTWDEMINALADPNVHAFDTAEILGQAIQREEYVYFRTDMHWTPYGSYLVYREMAAAAGKDPCDYEKDFALTVEEPFRGTYYRDDPTAYANVKPDALEILMPKVLLEWRRITAPGEYQLLDFLNFNARKNDRYTVYLGGPAGPWTYAQCSNGETENCLVLTDSFGLGYIPFLTANYAQVHYYDPRYFDEKKAGGDLTELIRQYNIQDIYVVVGDLHSFSSGFLLTTANEQLD